MSFIEFFLLRQISHDPSSPLPCHDWTDNDEHDLCGSQPDDTVPNRPLTPFRRMQSIDSVDSKSSFANSSQLSSSAESTFLWARPTISRLNSRTSGYSITGNSIKEEDEEEEDRNKNESDDESEPKLDDDIFDKPVSFDKSCD